MRPTAAANERAVASTVEIAIANVRRRSPAAVELLELCSFLASEDVPRRMLIQAADAIPLELRGSIADSRALQEAVSVLRRYELLSVLEDGLAVHRSTQRSVRESLDSTSRAMWSEGAARIVTSSFPDRPEDTRNWRWAARLLPHAVACADHLDDAGVEPLLAAELRELAARYVISQGQLDIAQGLIDPSLARVERLAPRSSLHATLLHRLAVVERERGWFNLAKKHAMEALGIHQAAANLTARDAPTLVTDTEKDAKRGVKAQTGGSLEVVDDLENLSAIARHQGNLSEAIADLDRAYSLAVELEGAKSERAAELLVALFGILVAANRVADGIAALQSAIAILEELHGPEDEDVVLQRQLYALLTEPQDRDALARDVLQRSEKMYGERHPNTADACRLLADLLTDLGQLDQARSMARRASEIDYGNYGSTHFRIATGIAQLIAIDAAAGNVSEAEDRLKEIVSVVMSAPVDDRATTLRLSHVGDALAVVMQQADGLPFAQLVVTMFDTAFADDKAVQVYALELVVKAILSAGDSQLVAARVGEAALRYREGLQLALLTNENSLDDAQFHVRLGLLAASADDEPAMLEHFRLALTCVRDAGAPDPIWQVIGECAALCGVLGRVPLAEQNLAQLLEEAMTGGTVAEFRGSLKVTIPTDWLAKESTTVLAPDGQANVIVSSEPLDPSIDTERYASVQGDLLQTEFPEYDEKSFDRVEIFGGRSGYIRHFQWTPPDGVPVVQIQLYHTENGRGYTATATTPAEGFPSRELVLRQILLGLRIVE